MGWFLKKSTPVNSGETKEKTPYQKGYESAVRGYQRKSGAAKAKFDLRYNSYPQTRTGRFNRALSIATLPAKQRTQFMYGIAPNSSNKTLSTRGSRGRPRGSYDPRYAQYGGVYGYRKMLNYQLRIKRLEAMRQATLSPQQQNLLNQHAQQQYQQRIDPERQVIPDTTGYSPLGRFNQEIDDAANAVS